jgi:DNA polymerase III epsilon subunit-like protein
MSSPKSNIKLIAFDFETGGINPQLNPILTGYFAAIDIDNNIVAELNLKIAPSEQFSVVEPEALKVNGLNMERHLKDPETLSLTEAQIKVSDFIKTYGVKGKKVRKPSPFGHNVHFDIGMATAQLVSKEFWDDYLSYRVVDTFPISSFLKEVGILPPEVGSLESLVSYLNIPKLKAHEAKGDTLMTFGVYLKMIDAVKNLAENSNKSTVSNDLLAILEK